MGTIVTIEAAHPAAADAIERAFGWFREVEQVCNRFDAHSEVRRLTMHAGVAVPVGQMLFAAVEFALALAEDTSGAFDPTVGQLMERRGFNRDYRTGLASVAAPASDGPVSYRDVHLDPFGRTITLNRPLVLDLGAIAKGLAIDLAAKELAPFDDYVIDAGGDLYLAGVNAAAEPWSVGIRHPRRDREAIASVRVSHAAICTSGDYERQDTGAVDGHHIVDPRNGTAANVVVSATVVAPHAMLADALATAAFVLGPVEGLRLLERHGVDGLLVSPTLECYATRGMRSEYSLDLATSQTAGRDTAVLPNP